MACPAMPPLSLPKGSRLFRRLDPERFRAAFQRFMTGFSKQCNAVVAIDGKLLRRSGCAHRLVLEFALAFRKRSLKTALHCLS